MVGLGPLTAALRLGQHYYQIYRAKEVQSPEYLRRQLKRAQRAHGIVIDDEEDHLENAAKRQLKEKRDKAEHQERETLRQDLIKEMHLREKYVMLI